MLIKYIEIRWTSRLYGAFLERILFCHVWQLPIYAVTLILILDLSNRNNLKINSSFLANGPILHSLKTPENRWFSGVLRECKMGILARNGWSDMAIIWNFILNSWLYTHMQNVLISWDFILEYNFHTVLTDCIGYYQWNHVLDY